MRLLSVRVRNYKGYQDSGVVKFDSGFNILVGQNNSGKTAFLEALQFREFQSKPHRSINRERDAPLDPTSQCEVEFEVSGPELRNILLSRGGNFHFPLVIPPGGYDPIALLNQSLETPRTVIRVVCENTNWRNLESPSHGLFTETTSGQKASGVFSPSQDRQNFVPQGFGDVSNDDIGIIVAQQITGRGGVYVFRAERLSLGQSSISDDPVLAPNAANLAAVLLLLLSNPSRYDRLMGYVHLIFPTIYTIRARPRGNQAEIQIWQVDPTTEREDLAITLSDSGTGVGQVLAILYVAITSNTGRTIVIDEPNSFLHPGASRKLMQILRSFDHHQYIISTHSPEVINVTEPSTVHLTRWDGTGCTISRMDTQQVSEVRRALMEVGARLSDVFGSDAVLWVEGPTEQECFPKVLRTFEVEVPTGTSIIALRSTSEIDSARANARTIWDIYRRISTANALIPSAIGISLDRETRSQAQMDDLVRESSGLIHFLRRRTYENFLLDVDAITAVLNETATFVEAPIESAQVDAWFAQHGADNRYFSGVARADREDPRWQIDVDAPKLLADLFSELSEAREEYRKVVHSVRLTEWLLDHRRSALEEVALFLKSIIENGAVVPST